MATSKLHKPFSMIRESLWFGQFVFAGFTFHPIVLFFAVSGSLMVSRIRIPKF